MSGHERFVNRKSSEYILPDGRFLREIGEGMMPRPHTGAESDMSPLQSPRARFVRRAAGPRPAVQPPRLRDAAQGIKAKRPRQQACPVRKQKEK